MNDEGCLFVKDEDFYLKVIWQCKNWLYVHLKDIPDVLIYKDFSAYLPLHKNWSFPLRISSVNVTSFFVQCIILHYIRDRITLIKTVHGQNEKSSEPENFNTPEASWGSCINNSFNWHRVSIIFFLKILQLF